MQLNIAMLQYSHGLLLFSLVSFDFIKHYLDLFLLHVDILLETLREFLEHAVLHLDLLKLGVKEALLFVELLFEFFYFITGYLCCNLEVVLILLFLSIVLPLFIVHLSHELYKLRIIEERVFSKSSCMIYLSLNLFSIVGFLSFQFFLQL